MNAVAPGAVKSSIHPHETYSQLDDLHPVGHMGDVSDIVDAILYLEFGELCDRRNPSRGREVRAQATDQKSDKRRRCRKHQQE